MLTKPLLCFTVSLYNNSYVSPCMNTTRYVPVYVYTIPSTWEASVVFLAYPGKTECPTPRSCPEPTLRACSPCSNNAGCVGWGMSTAWRKAVFQKTFSMDSWHLEGDPKAAHNCATRMSAREAWKHLTSTPIHGRTLLPTAWCGEAPWTNTSRQGERSWWMQKQEEGSAERSATTPTDHRQLTNATFVAEIVSPTSVSTATSDAATVEQTRQPGCTPMIKLDRRRPYT